jgi:hypothetical protein
MLVVGWLLPASAESQEREWLALGFSGAYTEMELSDFGLVTTGPDDLKLSGFLLGGEVRASWWLLGVAAHYRQGWLHSDDQGSERVISAAASLELTPPCSRTSPRRCVVAGSTWRTGR